MRAIARATPEGRICLLTKARSLANRLLAADPAIERVLWLYRNKGKHDGLAGFFRLTALLRHGAFECVWILHNSARYALAARAAGIPERHGYGTATQRWHLNRPPFLSAEAARGHPIDKASELLRLKGLAFREDDTALTISPDATALVEQRFGHLPKPWIAFGLGSSEAFKQWGAENFGALAMRIGNPARRSLFLLGGSNEREISLKVEQSVIAAGGTVHSTIDVPIEEEIALLSQCALYVGNDTGVANISAAVATDTIALFGGSPPLTHSPHFHPVTPGVPDMGMMGISVEQVMAEVRKFDIG